MEYIRVQGPAPIGEPETVTKIVNVEFQANMDTLLAAFESTRSNVCKTDLGEPLFYFAPTSESCKSGKGCVITCTDCECGELLDCVKLSDVSTSPNGEEFAPCINAIENYVISNFEAIDLICDVPSVTLTSKLVNDEVVVVVKVEFGICTENVSVQEVQSTMRELVVAMPFVTENTVEVIATETNASKSNSQNTAWIWITIIVFLCILVGITIWIYFKHREYDMRLREALLRDASSSSMSTSSSSASS